MKAIKIFFAISLSANALLAIAWFQSRSPAPPLTERTEEHSTQPTQTVPAPLADPASKDGAPATPPMQFDWTAVESDDYRTYIENLRAIGCPEETIRDIIVADVNRLFDQRRQETDSPMPKFEFWRTGQNAMAHLMPDPKDIERRQALSREKRDLLKHLLGDAATQPPDFMEAYGGANPLATMLDFLPADKQSEVMEVYQRFSAKQSEIAMGGTMDSEDSKALRELMREQDAEIAKIMTPEQKKNFDLRMSSTAMTMRVTLDGFDPTEQEFRDIFQIQKAFDDDYGAPFFNPTDQDEVTRRREGEQAKKAAIEDLLGEDRYSEYERAQDYTYKMMNKVAARFDMPDDAANRVYEMKQIAEQQAREVRNNANLSAQQRSAALAGIRAETESSIGDVFGQEGFDYYLKQTSSHWLKRVSPTENPADGNLQMDPEMMRRYGLLPTETTAEP